MRYEIITDKITGSQSIQGYFEDGKTWSIPMDETNSDYQRYLLWVENPEAVEAIPTIN